MQSANAPNARHTDAKVKSSVDENGLAGILKKINELTSILSLGETRQLVSPTTLAAMELINKATSTSSDSAPTADALDDQEKSLNELMNMAKSGSGGALAASVCNRAFLRLLDTCKVALSEKRKEIYSSSMFADNLSSASALLDHIKLINRKLTLDESKSLKHCLSEVMASLREEKFSNKRRNVSLKSFLEHCETAIASLASSAARALECEIEVRCLGV